MIESISISAAIIVKDEERCIARCLKSIISIFDEVVIVDTGSTDSTLTIISHFNSHKIKLFQKKWSDDFSEARNFAIEKCECDYIFFIDADEYIAIEKATFTKLLINMKKHDHESVFCPRIIDHDKNTSNSIIRVFANNDHFSFTGFVHEELRYNGGNSYNIHTIDIDVYHDGYLEENYKFKNKCQRNKRLNLKNLELEPNNLRWVFFFFRDSFEYLDPNYICQNLNKALVVSCQEPFCFSNIHHSAYSFAILDLMARAKLMGAEASPEIHEIISVMNAIIPNNSNSFYYCLINELFNWKRKAAESINKIITYKKDDNIKNHEMLHSEDYHIDAVLSFYLYEIGCFKQAKRLLISVEDNGFKTDLTGAYLKKMERISFGD